MLLFGSFSVSSGNPEYVTQSYLRFIQSAARVSGVYEPFFGVALKTWDNNRVVFGHVDFICGPEEREVTEPFDFVVRLRPNAIMHGHMDLNVAVDAYQSFRGPYNQPFWYVLMRWMQHLYRQDTWVNDQAIELWRDLYGIEVDSDVRAQPLVTDDIDDPAFFERGHDCSSRVMWSVVIGLNARNPVYRDLILSDPLAADAIDCMSPGQVGWIFHDWLPWTVEDVFYADAE